MRPPLFRPCRRTVRLRLTLMYGALFVACGSVLIGITYVLAAQAPASVYTFRGPQGETIALFGGGGRPAPDSPQDSTTQAGDGWGAGNEVDPAQAAAAARRSEEAARAQRAEQLRTLLTQSGIALAITTVIALGMGWLVAGQLLRRLKRVTVAARNISASNLHERLALDSPDDELKELGDTFDQLIARLESSFLSQRQFIANVSHELRTPMTRQRTVAQIALSDPAATVESLRAAHERVLVAGAQQEQLLLALLTLARGQAGLSHREPVDLAQLTADVVLGRSEEADRRGLTIRPTLGDARIKGDPALTERLIINLVDNALRHNVPGGLVEIEVGSRAGGTVLSVANSGPEIAGSAVDRLFLPFERLDAERTGDGLGLGLSIVRAIAEAHDADVSAEPRPGGGLLITVAFPAAEPDGKAPPPEPPGWR